MAEPYMDWGDATLRLEGMMYDADEQDKLSEWDIRHASDDLDRMGPFIGYRPAGQDREFPREGEGPDVPDAVLDWVALRAFELSTNPGTATRSVSAGSVSKTYAVPKPSAIRQRMEGLLDPYQEPALPAREPALFPTEAHF